MDGDSSPGKAWVGKENATLVPVRPDSAAGKRRPLTQLQESSLRERASEVKDADWRQRLAEAEAFPKGTEPEASTEPAEPYVRREEEKQECEPPQAGRRSRWSAEVDFTLKLFGGEESETPQWLQPCRRLFSPTRFSLDLSESASRPAQPSARPEEEEGDKAVTEQPGGTSASEQAPKISKASSLGAEESASEGWPTPPGSPCRANGNACVKPSESTKAYEQSQTFDEMKALPDPTAAPEMRSAVSARTQSISPKEASALEAEGSCEFSFAALARSIISNVSSVPVLGSLGSSRLLCSEGQQSSMSMEEMWADSLSSIDASLEVSSCLENSQESASQDASRRVHLGRADCNGALAGLRREAVREAVPHAAPLLHRQKSSGSIPKGVDLNTDGRAMAPSGERQLRAPRGWEKQLLQKFSPRNISPNGEATSLVCQSLTSRSTSLSTFQRSQVWAEQRKLRLERLRDLQLRLDRGKIWKPSESDTKGHQKLQGGSGVGSRLGAAAADTRGAMQKPEIASSGTSTLMHRPAAVRDRSTDRVSFAHGSPEGRRRKLSRSEDGDGRQEAQSARKRSQSPRRGPVGLFESGEIWLEKKRLKEHAMREQAKREELNECTFQPTLTSPASPRHMPANRARSLFDRQQHWRQCLDEACDRKRQEQREEEEREVRRCRSASAGRRRSLTPRGRELSLDADAAFANFHQRNQRWQREKEIRWERMHEEQRRCTSSGPLAARTPRLRASSADAARHASPRRTAHECSPGSSKGKEQPLPSWALLVPAPPEGRECIAQQNPHTAPGQPVRALPLEFGAERFGSSASATKSRNEKLQSAAKQGKSGYSSSSSKSTTASAGSLRSCSGTEECNQASSSSDGERQEVLNHLQALRQCLVSSKGRSDVTGWQKAMRVEGARLQGAGAAPLCYGQPAKASGARASSPQIPSNTEEKESRRPRQLGRTRSISRGPEIGGRERGLTSSPRRALPRTSRSPVRSRPSSLDRFSSPRGAASSHSHAGAATVVSIDVTRSLARRAS
eukprot:TRINITY_DN49052_c0_g1_i1.p1 TRINITY_DN49052_c0_g1~~TRINITY_DN49052_c0_g1_i1.p1  ORF type:complete len:1023 (-),score=212.60 TRINITY_DN49052_c0_g1_i1:95-3163(-)